VPLCFVTVLQLFKVKPLNAQDDFAAPDDDTSKFEDVSGGRKELAHVFEGSADF
jgi:hypothetical protein